MGTAWRVIVVANPKADTLQEAIEDRLTELESTLSHWDQNSEVSRFNQAAAKQQTSQSISNDLAAVIEKGLEISLVTKGAFNITLGNEISARGFGPNTPKNDSNLASRRPSHEVLVLELNSILRSLQPGVSIDLSAIAKGYAVAEISALLTRSGFPTTSSKSAAKSMAGEQRPTVQIGVLAFANPAPAQSPKSRIASISIQLVKP